MLCSRLENGMLSIEKQDGTFTPLASTPFPLPLGEQVAVTLAVRGNRVTASAGQTELSAEDDRPYRHGCVGWAVERGRIELIRAEIKTFE